ncbi:IS701 family transposase, partial [Siccirubricoccus deserti]
MIEAAAEWESTFAEWLKPFLGALGHKVRQRWAPVYVRGLLGPGERKSVQPMAARIAPADCDQLHHFISSPAWQTAPLEMVLAREADRLVGGPEAMLIIDDTALPKKGEHSVGVAQQYAGVLGKTANCQALVSLTLARGEVPVPVALRL